MRSSNDDRYKRSLRTTDYPSDAITLIENLLHKATDTFSVMVCGPKSSGKSTLARRLLNAILTRGRSTPSHEPFSGTSPKAVVWLDLDPGQPEFSPPGMLSLVYLSSCKFGPSYTHPVTSATGADSVLRSHYIGALSPSTDPGYYLQCASDLIEYHRSKLSGHAIYPLIVNCSGWILGTGLELLVEIIRFRFLTDVVYTSRGPPEVVDVLRTATQSEQIPLHLLKSHDVGSDLTASADLRIMQNVSYFHLDDADEDNLHWNSEPLSGRPPLVVHFAGRQQAILGVLLLGDFLDPDLYITVLEGCIVGLTVVEDGSAIDSNPTKLHEDECTFGSTSSSSIADQSDQLTINPPYEGVDPDDPMATESVRPSESSQQHHVPSVDSSQDDVANENEITDSTPIHLRHASFLRNSSDLPCMIARGAATQPLHPKYSYCIGQALIQSIDTNAKTLQLLTPIKSETLQHLHRQGKRIVLVRGRTDMPGWAFEEDIHLMRSRLKDSTKRDEAAKVLEHQARRDWAEGVPWATAKPARRADLRKASWKPWRARRDIRAAGEDSD